jgi:hypothetical protein
MSALPKTEPKAVASMCCGGCGKVISKETTLSGILDFVAGAEAAGWIFNEKGRVCCPECKGGDKAVQGEP